MNKIVFALILAFCASYTAFAQAAKTEQWEYLIVSTGGFSLAPGEEAEPAKTKYLGKRTGTLGFNQLENYQKEFDRLGQLNWELVAVVAPLSTYNNTRQSGEEQFKGSQFVFKRRFDVLRSRREADEQQQRNDQVQATATQGKLTKIELVDLDALEYTQKVEQVRRADEQKLRQALESVKNVRLKIDKLSSDSIPDRSFSVYAEVTIDGSADLLKNGNQYRISEAQKYLKEKAIDTFNQIGLRTFSVNDEPFINYQPSNRGNTTIKVSLALNSQGTSRIVAQGFLNGVYPNTINR